MIGRTILALSLALSAFSPILAAQESAAAAPVKSVSVEEAYQKEFAFLTAQKRELSEQLKALKAQSEREQNRLANEVATLQARVIAAENSTERLGDELNVADQAALSNQENSDLLQATFSADHPGRLRRRLGQGRGLR